MENSRLIVKGLPSNCTEKSLQQFFKKFGAITDCTLKYTKEGKFRKFAFVGFDNAVSASKAIAEGNNSFMQSSKIQVEICHPFGDTNKPRAWSKFAKDSSAYKRSHGDEATSDTKPRGRNQLTNASTGNMSFTIGIDQLASAITSEQSPKTNENDKLKEELLEGITGDTSLSLILSGLPSSIKQKNIKEWLAPIRIKALKIVRDDEIATAFVSFNRAPDVRRALQMDGSFLGGFKVFVKKVNESDGEKEVSTKSSKEEQFDPDEVQKEEDAIRDTILETGRLFVRNLPFVTTEDDLRFLFKKYGELADVQVIIDKKTGKCKGFAIVEFIFPENAVAAYSELDGSIFKGRMLHIIAGNEKRENKDGKDEVTSEDEAKIGYKAAKERKLKATSGVASHSWNALFLGPNAIADSLAEKLGKEKREIFDPDGKQTAGVKLALAETNLVQETRNFLIENGVQLDAFSRPAAKRSDKVILVKNLPLGTQADELERMFSRHGGCEKIIFPERGISALIVMGNKVDAKKVFQSLAYSRFRTKPLFLEWAPGDVFGEKTKTESSTVNEEEQEEELEQKKDRKRRGEELTEEDKKELRKSKRLRKLEEAAKQEDEAMEVTKEASSTNYETHSMPKEELAEEQDEREIEPDSTVFVKNLSFETTDAQLENFFKKRGMKYQSAQISKKLNPADPFKKLSMGFGFVQFYTKTDAENAVKELQGHLLNGHALELKISNREVQNERTKSRKDVENVEQKKSTKILVRNLPFQASIKEIEELFATFGEIKTVRIPKKMGTRDQHRGFGFVEFMSVGEAKRAFESLVHSTHLYGRRLVLEWAKEDDTVEEMRTKTSTRYSGNVGAKKRVKKRIDDLQAEIFAAGNVGDPEDDEE